MHARIDASKGKVARAALTRTGCRNAPLAACCAVKASSMAATGHDRVYKELLEWTRVSEASQGSGWAVEVANLGGAGRGLVALEDVPAGEVLIQVRHSQQQTLSGTRLSVTVL
eukprot:365219-Chlamydomonas_euryale.AAC.27